MGPFVILSLYNMKIRNKNYPSRIRVHYLVGRWICFCLIWTTFSYFSSLLWPFLCLRCELVNPCLSHTWCFIVLVQRLRLTCQYLTDGHTMQICELFKLFPAWTIQLIEHHCVRFGRSYRTLFYSPTTYCLWTELSNWQTLMPFDIIIQKQSNWSYTTVFALAVRTPNYLVKIQYLIIQKLYGVLHHQCLHEQVLAFERARFCAMLFTRFH